MTYSLLRPHPGESVPSLSDKTQFKPVPGWGFFMPTNSPPHMPVVPSLCDATQMHSTAGVGDFFGELIHARHRAF